MSIGQARSKLNNHQSFLSGPRYRLRPPLGAWFRKGQKDYAKQALPFNRPGRDAPVRLLRRRLGGAAHADVAVGELHEMPFPADQTVELVEDVLRGEGILFDMLPDKSIVTLWKPADNVPGFFIQWRG